MKYLLLITFFLGINLGYCQEKDFEILGNELAEAIIKNDSVSFYSLILPKEAIIEKFKIQAEGKLKNEAIESAIKNINKNYNDVISSTFGLSFFNLTTKAEIFNLDLLNIKYRVVEIEETKNDSSIIAIQGNINHNKFSHFTFYAAEFKEKLYLASHLIQISEVNKFEERQNLKKVKLSADVNGNLITVGRIELDNINATKKDIQKCILNSPITIGVKEYSEFLSNTSDFEFIKGQWQYSYYINNSSDFAGIVEFKYEFKISDGIIDYKYYDFNHFKDDSEYKSIGLLPYEINETVLEVFDKKQYKEIIGDIYLNQVLAIKRTKQFTDKCFE